MSGETLLSGGFVIIGAVVGGVIVWVGQWYHTKRRDIARHKAALLKAQFVMVQMVNTVESLKRLYDQGKNNPDRHLASAIFPTSTDWKLDRELIFDMFYKSAEKGTKASKEEKKLIVECAFVDKSFQGLLGAIEDKGKYYEKYNIAGHTKIPPKAQPTPEEQKRMKDLTDSIYRRLEKLCSPEEDISLPKTFKSLRAYMDENFPKLAIDYAIKENKA